MKIVATRKDEQNIAAIDPWTLVHFSAGLALGLMAMPREGSIAASIGYEAVEQFVERQHWGQELFESRKPESIANAVVDVAVFALGHWVGERWNRS